jgi:hypothetical protein
MNGESRVVIFFTRAVNELTPADAEGVVGGFFWAGDLFPRASCAGSNEREMFYVLAPDPAGTINGNVRSVAYVQRSTAGTIAHELQHLINASRRIFVNDAPEWEESWLNEGLSHIAEELVFYRRMGLAPGQNLGPAQIAGTQERVDITVLYGISNLLRLDNYLKDVEAQGPFQDDDDLATRGAICATPSTGRAAISAPCCAVSWIRPRRGWRTCRRCWGSIRSPGSWTTSPVCTRTMR